MTSKQKTAAWQAAVAAGETQEGREVWLADMPKPFDVVIERQASSENTFRVMARSEEEAKHLAKDKAHDYDFDYEGADAYYEVIEIQEVSDE